MNFLPTLPRISATAGLHLGLENWQATVRFPSVHEQIGGWDWLRYVTNYGINWKVAGSSRCLDFVFKLAVMLTIFKLFVMLSLAVMLSLN